jgi:hypothetical protein
MASFPLGLEESEGDLQRNIQTLSSDSPQKWCELTSSTPVLIFIFSMAGDDDNNNKNATCFTS